MEVFQFEFRIKHIGNQAGNFVVLVEVMCDFHHAHSGLLHNAYRMVTRGLVDPIDYSHEGVGLWIHDDREEFWPEVRNKGNGNKQPKPHRRNEGRELDPGDREGTASTVVTGL